MSRKKLVTIISATVVVVLVAVGTLVFLDVKAANELTAATTAYETSLAKLKLAVSRADEADKAFTKPSNALAAHIEIANILATQLGDGSDTLKAAIGAIAAAKKSGEIKNPGVPKMWAGGVPKNPTVANYDRLRKAVEKLITEYEEYAKTVDTNADTLVTVDKSLLEAWVAQAATAPETAATIITATPNIPQETWDAVAAVGQAIVDMTDPLGATAPELWKALQDNSTVATAAEKAIQDQKAADADAARRSSGGNSGGSRAGGSGGSSGGETSGGTSMAQIEAAFAAEKGVSLSDVHCALGTPPAGQGGDSEGQQGVLCTYSTPDRSGWHWYGIA